MEDPWVWPKSLSDDKVSGHEHNHDDDHGNHDHSDSDLRNQRIESMIEVTKILFPPPTEAAALAATMEAAITEAEVRFSHIFGF